MTDRFNPQFSKIGEILVHNEKITEDSLNSSLAMQSNTNDKIGQILINDELISEDDFINAYSMQLGIKKADNFIMLEADSSIASIIPEDFAKTNRLLAIKQDENSIVLAMEDPDDLEAIDSVKRLTNKNIEILLCGSSLLNNAIEKVYSEIQKTAEVTAIKLMLKKIFALDVLFLFMFIQVP